ncbi:MAG: cytochrome P450 [Ktedonobacteraceae bacterium]|nr:cytochrome P450 [Ktedonobacteraceae bacterium]
MATTAQDMQTTKTVFPPGPRKLPYIGNLLSLRRDPLGYIQQLQRTYGNMATIYLGKNPLVLLFKPEYVRSVLVENPRYFSNAGVTQDDENVASEGLLTIDGEKHRQQRRAVQPAFHKKYVEGYATVIDQYTQELLQTWQAGDTVDMSGAMQKLTLRIISKCLFNIDLSNQLESLGGAFNDMIGTATSVAEDVLRIRIDNPITGYGKRMAAMRRLDALIYTLIAQRRGDAHEQGDVLSMLLTSPSGSETDEHLSDKQIHDHILTFLAAGHETTANALVWTFYLLSEHPEIRVKLLNEIRTVLGDRTPTIEDLGKLTYTDWVLNESMRLYPPAWTQARFVNKEFELDGVTLQPGTLVMVSQWVLHRLPEIWGDPEAFRPERWDPVNGQRVPSGAYFPFGMGPRMCIGMPLAQMEAKMILATILQSYIPQPFAGYEPGLNPTITLRPKQNLRVQLIPAASSTEDASVWRQIVRVPDASLEERKGCRPAFLSLFDK